MFRPAIDPVPNPQPQDSRAWLTTAERNPPFLRQDDSLFTAINLFQSNMDLRLLPVVNGTFRVIGAVFEKDVRRLLLNPFGHALMRNPAYGSALAGHIRPCPTAESDQSIADILDVYRDQNGAEGMILTQQGRLFAVIANRRLVHLSAERDMAAVRAQIARARRIEQASARFEEQVGALARTLSALAQQIGDNARSTAMRAGSTGDRAATVAAAAEQTATSMVDIADRGRMLADAFVAIDEDARRSKGAASEAVQLVASGSARMRDLMQSAQSIDAVIALIGEIAGQVNLLALNATIEAARAGEAGRGFTVVANEVKTLANQAGLAARRITAHVEELRDGIAQVADGHEQVEQAIVAMARLSDTVEDAVGTQRETTRLIAITVEETMAAGTLIGNDIAEIGSTARSASDSAGEMDGLASRIHAEAGVLDQAVQSFLADLRAA
ncbi:MAG: chemotaxis protein [Alphaproteobacteria bacterium HGW-Alphaproteobacteria-16]|nr:MAG: chemotaxis protein [Alphaproteobacteria bacterium HGW-Alphaproteobacteria-16]